MDAVPKQRGIPYKFHQFREHIPDYGCILQLLVRDPGQLHNPFRKPSSGINEGRKGIYGLPFYNL
jgi:hypothetical protein